ncbi:MAG: sensor histidine kinase [Reyranellaceae bacterium]
MKEQLAATEGEPEERAMRRQAQKLECVGILAASITHDLNNLLAVLVAKLEGLADDLPSDSPHQQPIASALGVTSRGAALISRLMAFMHRGPPAAELTNIGVLLRGLHDLLRAAIPSNIQLTIEVADGLRPCSIERAGFEVALLNLVINARDAMPNGGQLRIVCRNHYVPGCQGPGRDWVEIEVSDTGAGMPEDVRKKAFEPFFTTKSVGKGTGLGLAMVREFVKECGGHITVDSTVGVGTTFHLYMSAARS